MAAFSFAFITFAMLASQSASTRSREDHGMLLNPKQWKEKAKSFLELHQFHVCSNFPPTPWEKWKQRDCCLFGFFHALFRDVETEGICEAPSQSCLTNAGKVIKETDFRYICLQSSDSGPCYEVTPKNALKAVLKKKPKKADNLSSFLELHLFMLASISPTPLLVLPWENLEQRDCCFFLFHAL